MQIVLLEVELSAQFLAPFESLCITFKDWDVIKDASTTPVGFGVS